MKSGPGGLGIQGFELEPELKNADFGRGAVARSLKSGTGGLKLQMQSLEQGIKHENGVLVEVARLLGFNPGGMGDLYIQCVEKEIG